MKERALFDAGPRTGGLTAKQALVLAILTEHGPQRQIDVGRLLHLARDCPVCLPDRTCQYASRDAGTVLDALGTSGRQLVIRRQTGRWELRHPPVTGHDPSAADWPEGF